MRGKEIGCFLEGPCFDKFGMFHVADIPNGRIFCVNQKGNWEIRCEYEGWPNGLKFDSLNRLFIADYRRGILFLDAGAERPMPFIETFKSEGFKGCNDLTFFDNGVMYFTDQGQTGLQDPTGRVFSATPDGALRMLLDSVPSPNGLVVSGDGSQLFVAATRSNAIWRLPLQDDGTVSKVGVFIQLSGGIAGPDGITLDEAGGLIVCHPGIGVWRFDERGRPTHLIESPPESVWTNISFAEAGGRELYITDSIAGAVLCCEMPFAGRYSASCIRNSQ